MKKEEEKQSETDAIHSTKTHAFVGRTQNEIVNDKMNQHGSTPITQD